MTKDCWKDFAVSGRISDYLKYREQERLAGREPAQAAWVNGAAHGAGDCPDRHGAYGSACR